MLGTAGGKHAIISAFDVGLCREDMVDVSCDKAVDCSDDIVERRRKFVSFL